MSSVCTRIVLILAAACDALATGAVAPILGRQQDAQDPLREWLESLVISVPDIDFVESVPVLGETTLGVSNLVCRNVDISNIESHFDTTPQFGLSLSATGLQVSCSGDWSFKQAGFPRTSGHGGVTIAIGSASQVGPIGVAFPINATDKLPTGALTSACKIAIQGVEIKFSGSILSGILNIFKSKIDSLIQDKAGMVCTSLITPLVNTNASAAVARLSDTVRLWKYEESERTPRPTPPMPAGRSFVNFERCAGVKAIDELFATLFTPKHLNTLVDLLVTSMPQLSVLVPALAPLAGSACDAQGHNCELDFNPANTLYLIDNAPIGKLGNVSIGVMSAELRGLDSRPLGAPFHLLTPVGPQLLRTQTALDSLGMKLTFTVNVTLPTQGTIAGSTLSEAGSIEVGLTKNRLDLYSAVGVDTGVLGGAGKLVAQKLLAPPVDKLNITSCLSQALPVVNITKLSLATLLGQLNISALGNGQLEMDLDKLLDNAVQLFQQLYGDSVPVLLDGLLWNKSPAINNWLATAVAGLYNSSAPCNVPSVAPQPMPAPTPAPEPPVPKGGLIDFTQADVVSKLNTLIGALTEQPQIAVLVDTLTRVMSTLLPALSQSQGDSVVYEPAPALPLASFPVPALGGDEIALTLVRAEVGGLASMSSLDLLKPTAPHALHSGVNITSMHVNITVSADLVLPWGPPKPLLPNMSVALDLTGLQLDVDTAAFVDAHVVDSVVALMTQKLMCSFAPGNSTSTMLEACVAEALFDGKGIFIPAVQFGLRGVSEYGVSFPMEMPIFEKLFYAAGIIGAEIFEPSMPFIQHVVGEQVLNLINPWINASIFNLSKAGICDISNLNALPPVPVPTPMPELPLPAAAIATGDTFFNMLAPSTKKLLDAIFGTTLGAKHVDELVDILIKFASQNCSATPSLCSSHDGRLIYNPLVPLVFPPIVLQGFGNLSISLVDASVDGLDSMTLFDLFEPVSNYTFKLQAALHRLAANMTLRVAAFNSTGMFSLTDATLAVDLREGALRLQSELGIDETEIVAVGGALGAQFLGPSANSAGSSPPQLNVGACVAKILPIAHVRSIEANGTFETIQLHLTDTSVVVRDIEAFVQSVINATLPILKANEATLSMCAMGQAQKLLDGVLNTSISSQDPANCTLPPKKQKVDHHWATIGTACAFSLAATFFGALALSIRRATNNRRLKKDGIAAAQQPLIVDDAEQGKKEGSTEVAVRHGVAASPFEALLDTLALHPKTGRIERYAIPLVIIFNMALFASANTGTGASVGIDFMLDGKKMTTPSLFDFTLANSVHDMWQAKVYALALIIAVFSGAWPYLKLLLMLVAWVVPTRYINTERRERLLMALDALGKWSLIDLYVLLMMMVAFRFHVELMLSDVGTDVDVIVKADWGFYGFLLATCMSLCMSHIILAIHRRVNEVALLRPNDIKESLKDHKYTLLGNRVTCALRGQVSVVGVMAATAALIAYGCVIDSFEFSFRGAASIALDDLKNSTSVNQSYSVVSLGTSLPGVTESPNSFGTRWLQVTFFIFAVVTPLAHLALMTYLWAVPLTLKAQRGWFVACEVLNAWSALDVFCVAIIAALLEIQQFVAFIVGDKCDKIDALLVSNAQIKKLLNGDNKCFDVIASLDSGCWFLFVASLVSIMVGQLVMRTCHKALRERIAEQNRAASASFDLAAGADGDGNFDAQLGCSGMGLRTGENKRELSRCRLFCHHRLLDISQICAGCGCLVNQSLNWDQSDL